ncbi:MAG: hypothetical protein V1809_00120 [Planctomycetota bacterium]
MKNAEWIGAMVAGVFCVAGCSSTVTPVQREETARPRVEQLSLSTAMESAYGKVDFSRCKDKKVFVETKALSKTDVEYVNSFVMKKVLTAKGLPVMNEKGADLKLVNTLEVSGTDEVKRHLFFKDLVVGQVKGTLTFIDLANGSVLQISDFTGQARSKRNSKGSTKVVE